MRRGAGGAMGGGAVWRLGAGRLGAALLAPGLALALAAAGLGGCAGGGGSEGSGAGSRAAVPPPGSADPPGGEGVPGHAEGSRGGGSSPLADPPAVAVRGTLSYPERIALPPDALVRVEVRSFDADGQRVVGGWREPLRGRQVPIGFELSLVPSPRHPAAVYELRGEVLRGIRTLRATRPVVVALGAEPGEAIDLGVLRLRPWHAADVGIAFVCGAQTVLLAPGAGRARLAVAGRVFDLEQVPSASGARYVAEGDECTTLHAKRSEGFVAVEGRPLPPCRRIERPELPFEGRGQEPGWHVRLTGERVELAADYGAHRLSAPVLAAEQVGPTTRVRAADAARRLVVAASRRVCRDVATGMPHPYAVTVEAYAADEGAEGVETLRGCGGRPRELLVGPTWVVESLDGEDLVEGSRIALAFDAGDRVTGLASCNRFSASYTLDGEGLRIGPAATTERACAEPVMRQEERFLALLARTGRFDLTAAGALVLHAGGAALRARAEVGE